MKVSSSSRQDSSAKKRENPKDTKPAAKSATVLLSTEKSEAGSKPKQETSASPTGQKGKPQPFCPYCDNGKRLLNDCSNFKELTKEQKVSWINQNNRCWRCGRNHLAANCALCKTCNRKHLLILHEVNDREKDKETVVTPTEKAYLVSTT